MRYTAICLIWPFIDWCKLFGSHNEVHQKLHWKNVVKDEGGFRKGLLRHLGIDYKQWSAYWRELKTYRDQHAAHADFNKRDVSRYPRVDLALSSSSYNYSTIIQELRLRGVSRYPDDLDSYCERFFKQAVAIGSKAIGATQGFTEIVY